MAGKKPEELWREYDILVGGLGELSVEAFSATEEEAFNKFAENSVDVLTKISPEVAKDFEGQVALFRSVGEVFKAKVDKAFGGILPSSGQFGVGLIIPQDIRYVATASATDPAYSQYELNSWDLSVTAGTAKWLLGDGTNFFKARTEAGKRCTLVIMKNGLIEVGTTPSFNQFIARTERISYPAFSVQPLVDQTIERNLTIYRYNLPFAVPVFYDFGVMLGGMPIRTGSSNLRLIGVIFYEYAHRESLSWVA